MGQSFLWGGEMPKKMFSCQSKEWGRENNEKKSIYG